VICHQLTGSKDIDLALNYMVNRLEEDRFLAEFRLLDVGDALVQLNDPGRSANPVRFHATVPRELIIATKYRQGPRFTRHGCRPAFFERCGQELDLAQIHKKHTIK
jgi:bifunctional DNA-binding transcriptional regulator/antitoxin component of YhaV-PrlF toxin-antitoxin module